MKNILFLHLESISNQTLRLFPDAFPCVRALRARSVVFRNFFASATSSLMAIASVWHGNSFELDHATALDRVMPAGLCRNIFSMLSDCGYHSSVACLNMNHPAEGTRICIWPENLEPVYGTDAPADLLARLDSITGAGPFAVYVWNLVSHVEQHDAESDAAATLADRFESKYRQADWLVGEIVSLLETKGLLDNTVVVLMGDHGDDLWTHGLKGGFLHAIEPYATVTAVPMSIYLPGTQPYVYAGPAGTVDIRNTVLGLLDCRDDEPFPDAGINLLIQKNRMVFSQNLLANQAGSPSSSISKAYAAMNEDYLLLAGRQGLEFYDHRLDPSNSCNLLNFFAPGEGGALRFIPPDGFGVPHFNEIFRRFPVHVRHMNDAFIALRSGLASFVEKKNSYAEAPNRFPLSCLAAFNRSGSQDFSFACAVPKRSLTARALRAARRIGKRVLER